MNRFENVDVLAALDQLMRQNTAFYRNDFEIDKEIIGRAAASDKAEDVLYRHERPARPVCGDRQGREPRQGSAEAPRFHPQAAIRNQTSRSPEKGSGQNQEKRIGGMTMVQFTVEEENLICMYHKSDRRRTAANIRAALPDMDEDMAALARQTADKLDAMHDADFEARQFVSR